MSQKDSCSKTSNNKFFGCPPRMDDARHFTDYRPNCYLNNSIRSENKTFNSFQYRMYLTHNAEKLMEMNRASNCEKNCCAPCQSPYDQGTMLPEESTVTCDNSTCRVDNSNPNGLGQGRNYLNQPLHCPQWPETLPTGQSQNKCAPAEDSFQYYPVDQKLASTPRLAVPGGGEQLMGGDPNVYN